MHEWSFFVQNSWIQDGRIQDGCHHQVEWEWMSLSQIKLIWVRLRVEWECFWVNLREEYKVSESNIAEFEMATIIKLSQNQWVKVFFSANGGEGSEKEDFCCGNGGNHLGKCDWVSEKTLRWLNPGWQNWRWQNSRWLPSSSWVRMNKLESDWISLSQCQSGVRVFLSESERR